jgi:predicted Zn-dependent protease
MMATMLAAMLVPGDAKTPVMVGGIGAGQALSLKYSREDEEEADRVGVGTAEKAGYNGTGTADFLKKLKVAGLERNVPQYLLTHPYPDERIAKIEILAKKEKTRVDVSLFPFLVARSSIISSPIGTQSEEIWMKRYEKDPHNALYAYGASLIVAAKGNTDRAVTILRTIDSPYKRLFLGELLTKARRFDEAVGMLEGETHPIGRFLLAKAYEGKGDLASAARVLRDVTEYGQAFPEIYHRLGMLYGRQGNQGGGYEYLGRYHLEMGREEAARMNLEKAVSIYGMNSAQAQNVLKILDDMGGKKNERARKSSFSFGPLPN